MKSYTLYKFTFPNGKIYIGQTNNFTLRMQQHKSAAGRGKDYCRLVDRAIRKYGWENIKCDVLETCDFDTIDNLERHYIALYKTTDNAFGYNLDSGGNINKVHSDETKKKISLAHMGMRPTAESIKKRIATVTGVKRGPHKEETKRKMSLASKGVSKSLEHRQKLALAKIGKKRKPHSEETKRKMSIAITAALKNRNYLKQIRQEEKLP